LLANSDPAGNSCTQSSPPPTGTTLSSRIPRRSTARGSRTGTSRSGRGCTTTTASGRAGAAGGEDRHCHAAAAGAGATRRGRSPATPMAARRGPPRTGSASRRARPPRLTRLAFRQVLSRKMPPPTQDPSARERPRMTALRNRDPIALTGVRFVGSRRWRSTPKRDAFLSAQSDARRFSGAEFPIGTPSPRETEYVAVDPMAS
jgi:hypothetical protein